MRRPGHQYRHVFVAGVCWACTRVPHWLNWAWQLPTWQVCRLGLQGNHTRLSVVVVLAAAVWPRRCTRRLRTRIVMGHEGAASGESSEETAARSTAPPRNQWADKEEDEVLAPLDNTMSPENLSQEEIRDNDLAAEADQRRLYWKNVHASLKFDLHDHRDFWRGPPDEEGTVRAERLRAKKRRELRNQIDTLHEMLSGLELQYASSLFAKLVAPLAE